MSFEEHFEQNRLNWDERARIHVRDASGFYEIEAFRCGQDVLGPIESEEIGDVSGKNILHLQCHFGLDTLCLARRGAEVTGLDFSGTAIKAARNLADETEIEAKFVEGNVYDAPNLIDDTFDMVYVTWGTICWLPDVPKWARIVSDFLVPNGVLYFADHHPLLALLEYEQGDLVVRYAWRTPKDAPMTFDEGLTYTGDETPLVNRRNNEWNHPLSEIFTGLTDAGLSVEKLREHTAVPWQAFACMIEAGDGLYRLPDGAPEIPLAVSLTARKSI